MTCPVQGQAGQSAGARVADDAPALAWEPTWGPTLLRLRPWLLAGWVLQHLLIFNGEWRIGPDSALFRSIAQSLASGQGYAVLGEHQRLVYPGFPVLLAGLELVFGSAVWPAIVLLLLMSAAVLWLTYSMMLRVVPAWAATMITVGVGSNALMVQHAHELLADIPFMLALLLVLWGWERAADSRATSRAGAMAAMGVGLGLAAVLRPTFWILALTILIACVGGLLARTRRPWMRSWRFYATCVVLAVVAGLAFAAIDPRTTGMNLLAGGYESEVADRIMSPGARLSEAPARLWVMFEDHLEVAFFALRIEVLNLALVAALLLGVMLLARYRPMWTTLVAVTLATVYMASSTPRYYLILMPILWLAWMLVVHRVAVWLFVSERRRSLLFAAVMITVINFNIGHNIKLMVEQRQRPFLASFEHGRYLPVRAMAQLIGRMTEPGERVIGPFSAEMTYLSGRRVLGTRELARGARDDTELAQAMMQSDVEWAVFPPIAYRAKDRAIMRLGRAGIFVPTNADDSTTYSAGEFEGVKWYLTRDWSIDATQLPVVQEP